jgi:hypothetical protein
MLYVLPSALISNSYKESEHLLRIVSRSPRRNALSAWRLSLFRRRGSSNKSPAKHLDKLLFYLPLQPLFLHHWRRPCLDLSRIYLPWYLHVMGPILHLMEFLPNTLRTSTLRHNFLAMEHHFQRLLKTCFICIYSSS